MMIEIYLCRLVSSHRKSHKSFIINFGVTIAYNRILALREIEKKRTPFSNSDDSRSLGAIDSLRCIFVLVADSEGAFISAFNGDSTVVARPIIRYAASHVESLILNNSKSTPDALPTFPSLREGSSTVAIWQPWRPDVILTRGDSLLWLSFTMACIIFSEVRKTIVGKR